MGMPKIQFTPEAIWSLVANHLEKAIVLLVILCSFPLALRGINALRLKTRSPKENPAEIAKQADNAGNLLSQPLPADQQVELNKKFGTAGIDAVSTMALWNPSAVAAHEIDVGFSAPVLGDIEKRKTPTVFPLENLFATAGIVARANRNKDQRRFSMGMGPDSEMGMGPDSEMGMGPDSEMGYQQKPQQLVYSPPATKMPYIILSGLIPYRKQMEEYYSLYGPPDATSSIRNIPVWYDFRVDRLEVGPTGDGQWKAVDLGSLKRDLENSWTGYATSPLPQQFRIPDTQNPYFYTDFPLGYWGGLPILAAKPTLGTSGSGNEGGYSEDSGESWGLEGIHPWVKSEIMRLVEEEKQLTLQQEEGSRFGGEGMYSGAEDETGRIGVTSKTEFSPFSDSQTATDGEMGGGEYSGDEEMYGMEGEGALPDQEYCIFRLVDTSVKPGHSYRYKVTLRVWNPNYEFPKKFLEEPQSSEVKYIKSATTEVYPSLDADPILVPADKQLFARILFSSQARGLKGLELLVLESNPDSGNFELQTIESATGNIVGAEKGERKIRNSSDPKKPFLVPPYDVDSNQTLLAIAGEQVLKPPTNKWAPPDPLEVLLADESGNLVLITPDASEELVKKYLPTVPGYQPSTSNEDSGEGM